MHKYAVKLLLVQQEYTRKIIHITIVCLLNIFYSITLMLFIFLVNMWMYFSLTKRGVRLF